MWSKLRKNLLLMPIESEEKDFTLIEDNLYLGNISFAQNHHSLKKYDISLVIAVYPKKLISLSVQMIPPNCRFHHIDAKDTPTEDLISHFDKCFDLINDEIVKNEGRVLVYCGAGLSRSVTIVSAYLMKKYRISCEEAVLQIRGLRRRINPNEGFLAQLKLYEDMSHHLDKSNTEYRLFVLIILKKQIWCEKYWEDSAIGALNRQFCEPMRSYLHKLKSNEKNPNIKSGVHYKCIECNHNLFEEINVLTTVGTDYQNQESNVCDNIFIEPINWLIPLICCEKRGDIYCPECKQVLGKFKWKSFQCICNLHNDLHDSKIIKIKKSFVIQSFDKLDASYVQIKA